MIRPLPLLLFVVLAPAAARAQIYRAAEMNTKQFEALDRARTVVLLPGGILEQHGPYLPSYSDGYLNEWLTQRLAEAVVARPGWAAVVFPPVPLGAGGANEIGRRHVFPGTFAVRSATLRAIFMDLATELGEQKFRRVFVVHGHGAPHLATASRGSQFVGETARVRIEYALKILDGYDERRQLRRRGDLAATSPANVAIDRDALAYEQEVERRQQAWLRKHNLR